jgi:hypothetical protein
VAHPGRGQPGRPLNLNFAWPDGAGGQVVAGTDDLPLFSWVADAEKAADDAPAPRFWCDDCSGG